MQEGFLKLIGFGSYQDLIASRVAEGTHLSGVFDLFD